MQRQLVEHVASVRTNFDVQDNSVRNMPKAWLPIPLQRALAFAIACAVCNAILHAFSLLPAAALPGRAIAFVQHTMAGL